MEKDLINLFDEYKKSPKSFANKYKNNKKAKSSNIKSKDYIEKVENLLQPYFDLYGKNKFAQIFYVIGYGHNNSICKKCKEKQVMFISFNRGYSKYCSRTCSIKDPSRVSEENRKIGTAKRNEKMKILLDDPIKGTEYRQNIGLQSSYYMNLPAEKERRSKILKDRIMKGEFTPNITNTWTHRESKVDKIPFRSSFEAIFYIYNNLFKQKDILFERLRIPYYFENKSYIYIVDFIDYQNKELFEIKPKNLTETPKNMAKRKALLEWGTTNNYEYYEITEEHLKKYLKEMIEADYNHDFLETFKRKYSKWLLT